MPGASEQNRRGSAVSCATLNTASIEMVSGLRSFIFINCRFIAAGAIFTGISTTATPAGSYCARSQKN
jgi:hypothetical protein